MTSAKAAVASLAEGIRADTLRSPIAVTTLFPGYIVSEMNEKEGRSPLLADTEPGVRAMIAAMEKEKAEANVPPCPWAPLGLVMRHLPLGVVSRFV